jgi:hypothetical protein
MSLSRISFDVRGRPLSFGPDALAVQSATFDRCSGDHA